MNKKDSGQNKSNQIQDQKDGWSELAEFPSYYTLEQEDLSMDRIKKAYPQRDRESDSDYEDRVQGLQDLFQIIDNAERSKTDVKNSEGIRTEYYESTNQGKEELDIKKKLDDFVLQVDREVQRGGISKELGERLKNQRLEKDTAKIESLRKDYEDERRDLELDRSAVATDKDKEIRAAWHARVEKEAMENQGDKANIDTAQANTSESSAQQAPQDSANEQSNDSKSLDDDAESPKGIVSSNDVIIESDGETNEITEEGLESDGETNEITEEGLESIRAIAQNMDFAPKKEEVNIIRNTPINSNDDKSQDKSIFSRWNKTSEERKAEDERTDRRIRALGKIAPFLVPKSIRNEVENLGTDRKTEKKVYSTASNNEQKPENQTVDAKENDKSEQGQDIVYGEINKDKNDVMTEDEKRLQKSYKSMYKQFLEPLEKEGKELSAEQREIKTEMNYLKFLDNYSRQPKGEREERIKTILSLFENPNEPIPVDAEKRKRVYFYGEKAMEQYAGVPEDRIPPRAMNALRNRSDYSFIDWLSTYLNNEERRDIINRLRSRFNIS